MQPRFICVAPNGHMEVWRYISTQKQWLVQFETGQYDIYLNLDSGIFEQGREILDIYWV